MSRQDEKAVCPDGFDTKNLHFLKTSIASTTILEKERAVSLVTRAKNRGPLPEQRIRCTEGIDRRAGNRRGNP